MSDLEARREARRRKIMENAENRLKKILNNDNSNHQDQDEIQPKIIPPKKIIEIQPRPPTKPVEIQPDVQKKPVSYRRNSGELRNIYQNPTHSVSSSSELEFTGYNERKSSLRDWIIILLALIVRFLFLVSEHYKQLLDINELLECHLNKVFVPFLVFEISEFMFFRPFTPQSGMLNMLLVMLNLRLRPEHINRIVMVFRIALRVAQDVMIYFFTFACFDQMIVFVSGEE